MDPKSLLAWAQVGMQLITVLGVPIAQVVQFCRQSGVSDSDLAQLELLWGGVIRQIEDRIAELKRGVSMPGPVVE
jgi:hypothetical protein